MDQKREKARTLPKIVKKSTDFSQESAKNDKKCALFTKKSQKIPICHHFSRVYPELFEGHSSPKPIISHKKPSQPHENLAPILHLTHFN
jgi:hypothetical protein